MSKHAYFIKAWADGAEVEAELTPGNWYSSGAPGTYNAPTWRDEHNYRLKPTVTTVTVVNGVASFPDGKTFDVAELKHEWRDCYMPDVYSRQEDLPDRKILQCCCPRL